MSTAFYATGASLKLSRAEAHIAEIDTRVADYIRRAPYGWDTKVSDEIGAIDIRLKLNETVPLEIAAIVGDALHNMRSSLDNLASGLAIRNGASAGQQRRVYFPAGQTKTEFENKCSDLAPIVGMAAANAVMATEIFVGGRGEKIKKLGEMSNVDKHRLLIPTVPAVDGPLQLGFRGNEPIPVGFEGSFEFRLGELGIGKIPACDGDLLLSFRGVTDDRFFVNYQPELTVSLDFQGVRPGESVVATLEEMRLSTVDAVDQIVAAVGSWVT